MTSLTESPALPRHIVTAIVVSHDGARWLPRVIDGLLGQHRPPQQVIAVDTGSTDASPRLLAEAFGEQNVIRRSRNTGFAAAVSHARNATESYRADRYTSAPNPQDWLWILHDDCEPAPDALVRLLHTAEQHPEAAVIGPKALGFYDRRHILDAGLSMAGDGRRWTGVEPRERDQGQHDGLRAVLAVSSAGMLVRRDVWDALGGFDRTFRLMREDIDFCHRVNAAGYAVLFEPEAVVHHAEAASRDRRPIDVGGHRPHLLERFGALYSLLIHAPGWMVPLLLVRVVLSCFLRSVGYLVAKMPGHAADEIRALAQVLSRPDRLLRGRRRRTASVRRRAELAPLFPSRRAVWRHTVDALATLYLGQRVAETGALSGRHRVVELGPVSEEMESLDLEGGRLRRILRQPAVILFLALTAVVLIAGRHLITSSGLYGGALLPAPDGASDLWSSFTTAWHPVGVGTSTAAPPYLALVALTATLLFGHAALAVEVLLFGSVPLAGLIAYLSSRELVPSRLVRVWGAAAYATLPVLTGALAAGRIGTALATALLPLLLRCAAGLTGTARRPGTTRQAWAGGLVLTVMTAFSPESWLLTLFVAVVWTAAALRPTPRGRWGRRIVVLRWLIVLAAPIVVLLPWSVTMLTHPGVLLSEAGLPDTALADPRLSPIDALLMRPGGPGLLPVGITVGILLAGLAALSRTTRRAEVHAGWAVGIVGFLTLVILSRMHVRAPGAPASVVVWPGMAAAFMGAGVLAAALIGAEGARDRVAASAFGWRQPAAVLVAILAAAAPVVAGAWWIVSGIGGPLSAGSPAPVPALAVEQAESSAHTRTLLLGSGPGGSLAFTIVRDTGAQLGDADVAPAGPAVDTIGGIVSSMLAGRGGDEVQRLAESGVGYVVALPDVQDALARTLDAAPGLVRVSVESGGTGMWKVTYPAGRVTVRGPNPTDPVTVVDSGTISAHATVPAGPAGRLLVLAEAASGGWTATLNGHALPATTYNGWQQAFTLPADGGTLQLSYSSGGRWTWVVVEALLVLTLVVMTLPGGRRTPDDEEEFEAAAVPPGRARPPRVPAEDAGGYESAADGPVPVSAGGVADPTAHTPAEAETDGPYRRTGPAVGRGSDPGGDTYTGYEPQAPDSGGESVSGEYRYDPADPYGSAPVQDWGTDPSGIGEHSLPGVVGYGDADTAYHSGEHSAPDLPIPGQEAPAYEDLGFTATGHPDLRQTPSPFGGSYGSSYAPPTSPPLYGDGGQGVQPEDAHGGWAAGETAHPGHGSSGWSVGQPHQTYEGGSDPYAAAPPPGPPQAPDPWPDPDAGHHGPGPAWYAAPEAEEPNEDNGYPEWPGDRRRR